MRNPILRTALIVFVAGFSALASVSAAEVSVTMQPKSFPTGRGGKLSVTVTGGAFDSNPIPTVPDGVTIRSYGTSQNIQVINGQMSQSITHNFVVSADEPGDYTIPSFEVSAGGQRLKTEPVPFTVTASATPPGLSSPAPGNPNSLRGSIQSAESAEASESFLKVEFPARDREHLYVGEMAPVRIKAYFPTTARVSLRSAPRPEGEGFTLHNLSEEPEQSMEIVNGKQYRTVTWFAGVSTVKAGNYPVRIALDTTIMTPERAQPRRMRPRSPFGSSFFDDPFFDNFFNNAFTQMVPQEVTLTSNGGPLDVRSLPSEGRPENFSGAVGQFSLRSYQLPGDATAGEPRQVRATIEGRGNFDRMSAPTLEPASEWKSYTPKSEFKPGDATSFSGRKTFEFSAVPQRGGDQEVQLKFSYFDPNDGAYKSLSSPAVPLKVAGPSTPPTPDSTQTATASAAPLAGKENQTEAPSSDLAPPRLTLGTGMPLLIAPGSRAILEVLAGVCVLLIVLGFVVRVIRKRNSDPERIAARKSAHRENEACEQAEAAASKSDAATFFTAARRALQARFAAAWNLPAESLTVADLRQKLPADSAALAIFRQADAIAYAPSVEGDQFDRDYWQSMLQRALAEATPVAENRPTALQPQPAITP